MAESRRTVARGAAIALLLVASSACAPALSTHPVAAPPPEPLTGSAIQSVGSLLEMEDRREYRHGAIESAASSPDPRVRRRAALTAARIGSAAARPLVRSLLHDPDANVVAAAALAAGVLVDSGAVPRLLELVDSAQSTPPRVAAEAADALGKIATEEARAALLELLLSADPTDAPASPVIASALIGAWRSGVAAPEPFARWLRSSDPELRWRAAYGLARRERGTAVRLLLDMRSDPHPLVRAAALAGLRAEAVADAGLSGSEILDALVPLLRDSAYSVRIEAIRTLASHGSIGVQPILTIAEEGGGHAVAAAIEALGGMGTVASPAAPVLRRIATNPANHVHHRALAARAAAAVDPQGSAEWLRIPARDPEWRLRAAAGLAVAGRAAVNSSDLESFVRDPDPRVAAAVLRSVAEWDGSDRILPLRNLLLESVQSGDLYVRAAALNALARVADATMFPAFLDAYQAAHSDPRNDAQLAAIDAIAALADSGVPAPERVFLLRFERPGDYLVRRRAVAHFGSAAIDRFGEPLPIETGLTRWTYAEYVSRWIAPARPDSARPHVRIETNRGNVDIELYSDLAPLTVANFLILVRAGFFDGQEWPRVVPNFVVQGGDPRGDTSGGPGYSIRDEIGPARFEAGTLGMAHSGPDTAGSQFFITHSPQPQLDGVYTAFGGVMAGEGVLAKILPGDSILRVTEIQENTES